MNANLLDTLEGYIIPEILFQASSSFGESEDGTTKTIGAAFPTILSALVKKSGDSNAMSGVMNLVTESNVVSSSILLNITYWA